MKIWSWEADVPTELIKAGVTPLIRPIVRVQNDSSRDTAVHAFEQAVVQLDDLRERCVEPPIGICFQDLGGCHFRPEEKRTLFDSNMPSDQVVSNIGWWNAVLRQFSGMWHADEVWNPAFVKLPRVDALHLDFEADWVFGVRHRDWRVAMMVEGFLSSVSYEITVTNWKATHYLDNVNTVCYDPAHMDRCIAALDGPMPKSAWMTAATRSVPGVGEWTPELQMELVKKLRAAGVRDVIYWADGSSHTDWKALYRSIKG